VAPDESPEAWGTLRLPGQASGASRGTGAVWQAIRRDSIPGLWLERRVRIPAQWQDRRIILRAELMEQPGAVVVDGEPAGTLAPLGDGVDLTGSLLPGKTHTIRLYVARGSPVPGRCAPAVFGAVGPLGVAGSLRLDALAGKLAIEEVFLEPSVRRGELGARVRFHCAGTAPDVTLRADVREPDGSPALAAETVVAGLADQDSVRSVSFPWQDPVRWELGRPHMYSITLTASDEQGKVLDTWGPGRFGFREFRVDGKQMLLNGHVCRLRPIWHWGLGTNNIAYYEGLGFNTVVIHPRTAPWFASWGANRDIDAVADMLDRRGWALVAPCAILNGAEDALAGGPRVSRYYRRAARTRIWRYANHPSILAWNVALNLGSEPGDWMPGGIGQKPDEGRAGHPVAMASSIVAGLDATRSVTAHGAGSLTPIAGARTYLGFVRMQEREEWLSEWAERGRLPFMAVEHGPPYVANFYRRGGPDPMFTEYCAMFAGDEAYRLEQSAYVEQVERLTRTNPAGHGSPLLAGVTNTAFLRVAAEHVRRTNRSWRGWGLGGGMLPWMWMTGFGGKRSGPMNGFFYTDLAGAQDELRRRPAWANPYDAAYRETMQPLLVYVGGRAERFTERDHLFSPGERVEKQIVAVWDGGWPIEIGASWAVTLDGEAVAGARVPLKLGAGEVRHVPIAFDLPDRDEAARGRIRLSVEWPPGFTCIEDAFEFRVVPEPPAPAAGTAVYLWDPRGESRSWIESLGMTPADWQPSQEIDGANPVLIIGRNALDGTMMLPYMLAGLDRGLTVLVLEQSSDVLQRFGFRTEDMFARRMFPRAVSHPVLSGIDSGMLRDWSGSATLLESRRPMRLGPLEPRCAHWGNYGVVASTAIEVPHRGNFTPLIDGGFDMRYSPLLEWRCGRGRVVFCQLDLTGRVGVEPGATQLACNLLSYVCSPPSAAAGRAVYVGGPRGRALVENTLLDVSLAVSGEELPEALAGAGVVIVGEGLTNAPGMLKRELSRVVRRGGWVVSLPKTPDELNAGWQPFRLRTERRKAHRAGVDMIDAPPFAGLGPADFHWRDVGEFDVFVQSGQPRRAAVLGDGFFLVLANRRGKGGWLFSQADPSVFSEEAAGTVRLHETFPISWRSDTTKTVDVPKPWLRETRHRMARMYAQLLANLGAGPSERLRARMIRFTGEPRFVPLTGWASAGPFPNATLDDVLYPDPEWKSVNPGRERPDITWHAPSTEGVSCYEPGWKSADRGSVTYFRATLESGRETARLVRFHPWRRSDIAVWCNGVQVFRHEDEGRGPRWAFEIEIPCRRGNNELVFKVRGVPRVAACAMGLPRPALTGFGADLLYSGPRRYGDDPYAWFPW